jgi:hypothetical protein
MMTFNSLLTVMCCRQLEESLELMGQEFESMEDYWQQKLDAERTFGEEQLRSSEEQFRELEGRMREYEELIIGADGTDGRKGDGTLPTIAEDRDLEEKVRAIHAVHRAAGCGLRHLLVRDVGAAVVPGDGCGC